MIHITEDIFLNEDDIVERFVRAAGSGGQHVPHRATAVELSLDLGKLALPEAVAERLMTLAGRHITNDGVLVVVARQDRSQRENREAARAQLLSLLERAADVPAKRQPTRPGLAVRKARKDEKQLHAATKRARHGADDDR